MLLPGLRDARADYPTNTECFLMVCSSLSVKHVSRGTIIMYFVCSSLDVRVACCGVVLAELIVKSVESVNICCKL